MQTIASIGSRVWLGPIEGRGSFKTVSTCALRLVRVTPCVRCALCPLRLVPCALRVAFIVAKSEYALSLALANCETRCPLVDVHGHVERRHTLGQADAWGLASRADAWGRAGGPCTEFISYRRGDGSSRPTLTTPAPSMTAWRASGRWTASGRAFLLLEPCWQASRF